MNGKKLWLSIDSAITRGVRWFVYLSAASAGVMMLLAVSDVIGAKFFHHAILGAGELIEELNIVLVFMAIAYVQVDQGHIRITFLEKYMPSWLNFSLKLLGYFLGVVVFGFLSWRALALLKKYIAVMAVKEGAADFILWPFASALLLGLILLTIVFAKFFISEIVLRPRQ